MTPDDFPDFFEAVHGHRPFLWQSRLARQVADEGAWPDLVDLPTAAGKTAVIDMAVFALSLEVNRPAGQPRRAALRTFFVIDRRLVVDDA
jgi:CRISPR-associated endonuclease/helicase Cas3